MISRRVSGGWAALWAVAIVAHLGAQPVLLAADAAAASTRAAAVKSAAELLPPTTLFYIEVERPADLIRLVLDHPLRKRLEQSPDYQNAFNTPQFKEFRAIVEAVEQRSGGEWRKALEVGTGGGLVVAVDAATQGLVVLARSTDVKASESVRDALFSLAREDAQGKGNADPIGATEYRGLAAHQVGGSIVANVGPWLVVSNKQDLAKSIADLILDGGASLAVDEEFSAARPAGKSEKAGPPTAWAFLRMAPLRAFAAHHPAFDKTAKSDNPAAELLFGGLAGALRNAPYFTGSVNLHEHGLKLSVSSPHDKSWVPAGREFFFPPAGGGGADRPLKPKGTILSVTTYRDLAAWWEAGPDTYTEGVAAQMAQTDSGLSTFLGGKSFGTDVLGSFAPQIQLVVATQDFKAAGATEPAIRLPAGALVFRMREKPATKADVKKHFRVAFQSIVALGNLDGASKGRPLLEMKTERRGDAEVLYAVYESPSEAGNSDVVTPDDKPNGEQKGAAATAKAAEKDIYYNFSPALVIAKDRLMLCSTKQIADELVDLAAGGDAGATGKPPENTLVEISAQPIAALLRDNREQLVAQNMLEKGHARDRAEKEIDVFIALVNAVSRAKFSLTPTDKTLSLDVEINTSAPK